MRNYTMYVHCAVTTHSTIPFDPLVSIADRRYVAE